jgi:predicted nucleic acid-binding Zn ribbon protein
MPTYDFYNTETGEEFSVMMKIAEREEFLKSNPHVQQVLGATATVGGVSITDKVPSGFKEVLSKVAENHKSSSVAEKHGKKTINEVKTRQLVDKHYKKQIGT